MNLQNLRKHFSEEDIEWRIQSVGKNGDKIWAKCLAYIDARAVQDRLDEVCKPENWQVKYQQLKDGWIASLSIRHVDGTWVEKQDGADPTDTEGFKGGISSALKRAASAWGVGRYLYGLEVSFVQDISKDRLPGYKYQPKSKYDDFEGFYWKPPQLPDWARPEKEGHVEIKMDRVGHFVDAKISDTKPELVKKPLSVRKEDPPKNIPNRSLGTDVKPQSNKWADYTLKTGKTKGQTIKQIGVDGAFRYKEWLEGLGDGLKGSSKDDYNALVGFQQECAAANPAKVWNGNPTPPMTESKALMFDDVPDWGSEPLPEEPF